MSLDIAILGENGTLKTLVSIGADDHYRLMQLVNSRGGLLARLKDYYADAEFEPSEMERLAVEVEDLISQSQNDDSLSSFLKAILGLTALAKSVQKPLIAIAD
jgi:hypothetical protein